MRCFLPSQTKPPCCSSLAFPSDETVALVQTHMTIILLTPKRYFQCIKFARACQPLRFVV